MIYQRIIVAADGSSVSELALHEAIRLAQDQKASIRIIHIVDENYVNSSETNIDYPTLWQAYREEGIKFLDEVSEKVRQAKIPFDCRLIEIKPFAGKIAEKIVEAAKEWSADLLVLGTHGRRGFNHFLLGSVAEHVIRSASTPILLIRGQ